MSSDELKELQENAEHAREERGLAPVTLTMAVLAVLVAMVSLLGHRTHTEEVVLQDKITDQWAYYQAKNIRRHTDELFVDLTSSYPSGNPEQTEKLREKYKSEAERYNEDQSEASNEAHKLENEAKVEHRRADRYDLSEALVEIALVITSITLLSKRRVFWFIGIIIGIGGIVLAITGFLIA